VRPPDPDELSAYALGALDADEVARIEAHLHDCPDCRAALADLRQVTDQLDRLPPETFVHGPPDGDQALRRALRRLRKDAGKG
jgi:anti-sigma factor RsiW